MSQQGCWPPSLNNVSGWCPGALDTYTNMCNPDNAHGCRIAHQSGDISEYLHGLLSRGLVPSLTRHGYVEGQPVNRSSAAAYCRCKSSTPLLPPTCVTLFCSWSCAQHGNMRTKDCRANRARSKSHPDPFRLQSCQCGRHGGYKTPQDGLAQQLQYDPIHYSLALSRSTAPVPTCTFKT